MPRATGTYTLPPGYLATTGQVILASQHNPIFEDVATALTDSLPRDGSAPMQAALPMGGYQINGMADGVLPTDAATVGQSSTAAATAITTAPLKATPVDADTIPLVDSAAGNIMKRLTWANLKALFQPVNAVLTALGGIGTAVPGDVIYSSAAGVWARKAKGADGQFLSLASGLPVWTSNTGVFTKSYESGPQTLTPTSAVVLPHSLGVQPKLYQIYLKNSTAEGGYSIGEEVNMNPSYDSSAGTAAGISVVPDATNMNVKMGSGASLAAIINKSSGNLLNITNANWKLIVRAWA